MLVESVNVNDLLMANASKSNFKHSTDYGRYGGASSNQFSNAGYGSVLGNLLDIVDNIFNEIKGIFSVFNSETKNTIIGMITSKIEEFLGRGNSAFKKSKLIKMIESACGHFDSDLFGKYADKEELLYSFSLAAFLTGLLCLAIKGVLAIMIDALKRVGLAVDVIVGIVEKAMDFSNIKVPHNLVEGVARGEFSGKDREYISTQVDITGIATEILQNDNLINTFKNTPVARSIVSSFQVNKNNHKDYKKVRNALLPNWDVKDLANSSNASNSLVKDRQSTPVKADLNNSNKITKDQFMMLVD